MDRRVTRFLAAILALAVITWALSAYFAVRPDI